MMRKPLTGSPPWPNAWRRPGYPQPSSPALGWDRHWGCASTAGFSKFSANICGPHPHQLFTAPVRIINARGHRCSDPCPHRSNRSQPPTHTHTPVWSVDGVGTYDTISRGSMLRGFPAVPPANRSRHNTCVTMTKGDTTPSAKQRGANKEIL